MNYLEQTKELIKYRQSYRRELDKTEAQLDKVLQEMWNEFGNVPIDDDDDTLCAFYDWEAGTDRMEIWHWFDDNHSTGVATLVGLPYGGS